MIIGSLLAIVAAVAAGIAYFGQQYVGRKVREYWQQVVSANPDYISQLDVYEADEWELKRDDLELGDELGRGTFGKVCQVPYAFLHTDTFRWFAASAKTSHRCAESRSASVPSRRYRTPQVVPRDCASWWKPVS